MTTPTQGEKVARFRARHAAPGVFVMPNPWDAGSARLLASLGFEALATSSYAAAGTLGRRDGHITRDESIAMARAMVEVTAVPVSADFEDGFGAACADVQETVRRAGAIGLAGCSIEDAPGEGAPYDFAHAVERVAAAVEAVRALPVPIVLTARAENFLRGKLDLDDTIRRLQAFERAGAEVLFAPGLPDLASIRAVCAAVKKPVNVVSGSKGRSWSVAQLAEAGVKRINLATSLYRVAMTALRDAASEVRERGTFEFGERIMTFPEVSALMEPERRR